MTNDDLRKFWREQGGSFEGPIGSMPEDKLLPLLHKLLALPKHTVMVTARRIEFGGNADQYSKAAIGQAKRLATALFQNTTSEEQAILLSEVSAGAVGVPSRAGVPSSAVALEPGAAEEDTDRRIGRFFITQQLFEQVREHMATALKTAKVSDETATSFLAQHPALLGSIVGYDEVDTVDRERIWKYCTSEGFSSN